MKNTKIEWCHHTFNPWIGCTKISPACDHCYAEQIAGRFGMAQWGDSPRKLTSQQNWKQPIRWNRQAQIKEDAWNNFIAQNSGLTDAQLIEKGFIKPERPRVFCGSMCDIFDNQILPAYRLRLFQLIYETPYLDWLLLTKRIGNAEKMLREAKEFHRFTDADLKNVWIGATVCDQQEADRDIPKLLDMPATKRFLSIEPMLGPIDLEKEYFTVKFGKYPFPYLENKYRTWLIDLIDWVIVGGESGPKARPMHPGWARSIRDQCKAAGVSFFFKQWGEWKQVHELCADCPGIKGRKWFNFDPDTAVCRIGTKAAGHMLDGIEYKGVPAFIEPVGDK